ncbi:MAG: hypothetical protein WC449_04675 [Candidatus Paceibacterota bacterium]
MKEQDIQNIRERYNLKNLAVYQDGIVLIEGLIAVEDLLMIYDEIKNLQKEN